MEDNTFGLMAKNLKCIGPEPQGFEVVRRINVVVGRNNSGKSSLLDLALLAVKGDSSVDRALWHGGQAPSVLIRGKITAEDITKVFPANTSGGALPGPSHFEFGLRFIGATIESTLTTNPQSREFSRIYNVDEPEKDYAQDANLAIEYMGSLASRPHFNPLLKRVVWKIEAERNISPEQDTNGTPNIQGNGSGATDAIQQFLNKAQLPRELVRATLLNSLNEIFQPDSLFTEILCRQLNDGRWEVFLSEKSKGLVALSQSGSGLKTVILALCFIHLAPAIHNKPLSSFVLAFEELENNLHPALQRRLLTYLAAQAEQHEFTMFLTTHSSVAIDLLNKRADTEIIHVTHNGTHSSARSVRAFIDNRGVLDDLDVRASDLLQANGVLWVEGPSDRLYLTKWISLWSNGEFVEGNHYQCIFYGGRLLSHLSAEEWEAESDDGVSILRVNRNACVVMDSDRRDADTVLGKTKLRIVDEMEKIGGLAWITDGREIENYVPFSVLQLWAEGQAALKNPPGPFDSIFEYLDKRSPGLGKRYATKKHVLAEQLCALTTRAQLESNIELSISLSKLCSQIRAWNHLPEPAPPELPQ